MRYRIVKKLHGDGSITYMPQVCYFFGLICIDMYRENCINSIEWAKECIAQDKKRIVRAIEVINDGDDCEIKI